MTRDDFNKQIETLIAKHSDLYGEYYQQNENQENSDGESLVLEGYHDGFSEGVSSAWGLFLRYEKEISDD